MRPGPVSPAIGIALWMGISALAFGVLMGLVRHLGDEMHIFTISFWRFVFSLLLFAPWFWRVGRAGLSTRRLPMHVIRAGFLVTSSVALLSAIMIMPLDEATALSFTTPLFAVIGAMWFLREQAGPRRWAALIIGFIGILVILRPGMEIINWAAFLVIFSSVTFAGVILCGKALVRSDSPEMMVAYLALISVPLSFVPAAFFWQWPTLEQLLWLVGIAICSIVNMYGIAKALQLGDASATQPYDFLRLPTTAIVGWVAFAETSDIYTWIGAVIIFSSTVYITRREALANRRAQADEPVFD